MKNTNEKKKSHTNSLLKIIQDQFSVDKDNTISFSVEYFNLFLEILRTNNTFSHRFLEVSIIELKRKNTEFNFTELLKEYNVQLKKCKVQEKGIYQYYFLLNHSLDIDITLNNFIIRNVKEGEKEEILKMIIPFIEQYPNDKFKKVDTGSNLYVFETNSFTSQNVLENFYSTFHLYKGILEYSYHRFKWKFESFQIIKNKKEFSTFKYPQFFYIRDNGYVDFIENEDYPYDYMKYRENVRNIGNQKFFEETLKVFTENKLDPSIEEILSDCFRLYGMGIDNPYIDQSFLFFWNVLEKITLSYTGKTEEIIKRVRGFLTEKFWNENQFSIDHIKNTRNNRVHRGIGDISVLDLNLLKYLCDTCILSVLGNPPGSEENFKTVNHLETYYKLKDDSNLGEIKDILDFMIKNQKKQF